ncbi:sigma-70 family RNA polymerase sigma factor [Peribacillus frigoritolerans]|uniref:sigma-70 family RNA polymerase sigma factor n=1 Tax=Peribacillus frigoritolerans TaxID=450367 RepID=UPI0032B54F4A
MPQTKEVVRKKKDYKVIESHLRNYRNYLAGIKNMNKQMDYIMPGITANYELREESMGAFVFSSSTEKFAIDRIESKRALQLHEDIMIYELIINSIDVALAELDDDEREFVELRYFKNQSILMVAEKMGYSERQVFLIRNAVREILGISLKNLVNLRV